MNQKIRFLSAISLAAGALLSSANGCELIASVDRSKIAGSGGGGAGGAGSTTSTTSGGGTGGIASTTSGGGTGGIASTTGGGGTGGIMPMCAAGVMACSAPSDCPDPGTECILRTCEMGCCGATNVADNTPTTSGQTFKDCKQVQCDGAGDEKIVNDDTDVPDGSDDCHIGGCDMGNQTQTPAPLGTTCDDNGGKVCDNAGACVGCNSSADCTDAANPFCSASKTCVPATCNDGQQNGDETDKDCGGACGATCVTGQACMDGGDCVEGVCNGTCQLPTCGDGVQNGDETGIDCGGSCVSQGKLCASGEGCTQPTDCTTGACDGTTCIFKSQGTTCNNHDECGAAGTNLCVDGFCCDTSCTNGCQACSAAKKGSGGGDGICGNIALGTDPNDFCATEAADTCGNTGMCDGAGACQKHPAGTTCRASADVCDVAETCPGGGAACPADGFLPDTIVCRAATAGGCDVAETCTGSSAACPADVVQPSGTVCRAAVPGGCDVAETCNGTSNACPADTVQPSGTVCRAAVPGGCDVAETCNGTANACPADAVQPSGTVCRAAVPGGCDVAETCNGTANACPADTVQPSGTVCRAAVPGGCDVAETCNGTANACPADAVQPSGTVCRAAVSGGCDVAETCNGTANACPADAVQPSGTVCRAAVPGGCDVAETCNGTANACPADAVQPSGTVCRAAVPGGCDVAETCNGTANACPADAFAPSATQCRASAGVCDVAETCTGTSAACPANAFRPAGFAPTALQTPGDCQKIVCTGTNATSVTSADDVIDVPTSSSACLINPACDTSGGPATPYFDPAPTGTSCTGDPGSGAVCGDTSNPLIAGTCVECNTNADCFAVNDAGTLTCNTSTGVCE
ncbi:Tetratricopeptide TPR_2 repeat protein [Minicystis rosea]|nr:Tetratricopeptide TPR_2 repeat protein [Minicystis rosea]